MTNQNPQHTEGTVARSIEQQTAKITSDWFLWAAGGAIAASLLLRLSRQKHAANFVGEWAPTILILGLYNKIVKTLGSDGADSLSNDKLSNLQQKFRSLDDMQEDMP